MQANKINISYNLNQLIGTIMWSQSILLGYIISSLYYVNPKSRDPLVYTEWKFVKIMNTSVTNCSLEMFYGRYKPILMGLGWER